jgi:acetyltransferase
LAETVQWQGQTIVLRPIRPEDGPQHLAFVEQLAPQDLRLRFFSARRELPKSELARLTQIDYAREMAFIAVRPADQGREETLGVVRAVTDPDNIEAEFAIIVRSDLKQRGLGRILLHKMIDYLRAHGTQQLVCDVLPENESMRQLARSEGMTLDRNASSGDALRFVRSLL